MSWPDATVYCVFFLSGAASLWAIVLGIKWSQR